MHGNDPLRDDPPAAEPDLSSPFAMLDPRAVRRILDISQKLQLPGAHYSPLNTTTAVRGADSNRWSVKAYRAGEAPQPSAGWDADDDDAEDARSS